MNQPNILFIMTDQQHYEALGFRDSSFHTPNLDELAQRSSYFPSAFCTTPQCSPSRSSLLTGQYPSKTGVLGNIGALGGNPLQKATIFKTLKDYGYSTFYHGKWHLGGDPIAQQGLDHFSPTSLGEPGIDEHQALEDPDPITTRDAIAQLQQHDSTKPFAMLVSINDPHDIYDFEDHQSDRSPHPLPNNWEKEDLSRKPFIQKQFMQEDQGKVMSNSIEQWKDYRCCYRDKVELADRHIGKILNTLKEENLEENTIVIFTADHGDMDGQHRLIFKGPFMYENMLRVPLIIHLPKSLGGAGATQHENFSAIGIDIVPTIMEIIGANGYTGDGISLLPLLKGQSIDNRPFVIAEYYSKQQWANPIRSIRTKTFKYNRVQGATDELYDLQSDPEELNNLIDSTKNQGDLLRLREQLDHWMDERQDPFKQQIPTDRMGNPLEVH